MTIRFGLRDGVALDLGDAENREGPGSQIGEADPPDSARTLVASLLAGPIRPLEQTETIEETKARMSRHKPMSVMTAQAVFLLVQKGDLRR
jgi:hypothetical protein